MLGGLRVLVVGLNGSPRRQGSSDALLRAALRGAEEEGARTARFDLAFMGIAPCRACEGCFEKGECVQDDDMSELYEALEAADAVLVASPIYFSGMSAQTKVAVDRCQALWARRQVLGMPRRPGVGAIMLSAARQDARFDNALSELRAFLIGIGLRPMGELTLGGSDQVGASERPEVLAEARELGRRLVLALSPGP
ncbi:MAG: flavodoxin family protein [Methanomassiliicoccales archaeon]|nr:flavodoxin family protein [Methanomassiliicoccales archaeon]